MEKINNINNYNILNNANRLEHCAGDLIVGLGLHAVSSRSIAKQAQVNASAINYNFGSIKHLYITVFEKAMAETAAWIGAITPTTKELPRDTEGAKAALEYVIRAWTSDKRSLALLYQEARSWLEFPQPLLKTWSGLWSQFWIDMACHFGLKQDQGVLMHLFFESEALYHLSNWNQALETFALRDLCQHFGYVWLGGAKNVLTGALMTAQEKLLNMPFEKMHPQALQYALTAVSVVKESGLNALTHRAVAAKYGVTVGAISNFFPTAESLIEGTIRAQVEGLFTDTETKAEDAIESLSHVTFDNLYFNVAKYSNRAAVFNVLNARRSLFLSAIRMPNWAFSGAIVRFSHGRTTEKILGHLIKSDKNLIPLHASLYSRLVSNLFLDNCQVFDSQSDDNDPWAMKIVAQLEAFDKLNQL